MKQLYLGLFIFYMVITMYQTIMIKIKKKSIISFRQDLLILIAIYICPFMINYLYVSNMPDRQNSMYTVYLIFVLLCDLSLVVGQYLILRKDKDKGSFLKLLWFLFITITNIYPVFI